MTNPSTPDAADAPEAAAADPRVSNIDLIKALADPLRMNLLYVLTRRTGGTLPIMSVKELAAKLGEPQTKLYRHVRQLESVGLIHAVASRVVSGIIEKRYQANQPDIVIGDTFTEQEKVSAEAEAMAAAALELYRRQYFAAGRTAMTAPSGGQPLLGTASARLPAARVAAIRGQLQRIFDEIAAANAAAEEANGDDLVQVSLLVGIFSPSQE